MSAVGAVVKPIRQQPRPLGEVETITPEKAAEYLKTMAANRPQSQRKVIEYATQMDEGKWVINGDAIKFTAAGNLFDGQHRLEACMLAGKPFQTFVIRGIEDPRAFSTVDVGKMRSFADLIALKGHTDQNNVAAAASLLYYWKKGRLVQLPGPRMVAMERVKNMAKGTRFIGAVSQSAQINKTDLLEFIEPYAARIDVAIKEVNNIGIDKVIARSIAVACLILFSEKDAAAAHQFITDLASGAGLNKTDPVLVLREKLRELKKRSHFRLTRYVTFLMMIKAWNARRSGESWRILKVVENEKFPKIK